MNEKLAKFREAGKNPQLGNMDFTLILRLRQAVTHPFLLEWVVKNNLDQRHLDNMKSELDKIGLEKRPVHKQLELFLAESLEDPENFGTNRFGYEFDIKEQLEMASATLNDNFCKICLTNLLNPHANTCDHVFCLFCITYEVEEAKKKGRRKATCPICEAVLQHWRPVQDRESSSRGEAGQDKSSQPSKEMMARYKAAGLSPEQIKVLMDFEGQKRTEARQDSVKMGRDGKILGNDYLDIQPRTKGSTSAFLRALDAKYPEPMVPSAKTTTVKHTVLEWQRDEPDDKIIIFTQWLQEGQILGRMLQAEGFGFVYFFGEMSEKAKSAAKETFHKTKDVKIMRILVRNSIDERMHRLQIDKTEKIEQAMQCSKGLSALEMIGLIGNLTVDENGNTVLEPDYGT
ncbi:hypothetical protein PG997_007469 [Apiospora hydei]|uniref:RING-type domain-containing protein n=1 Tax=Apiospora hydei TaxID=1337664 RepID=A0ABR1W834_9PEZI